MGKFGWSYPPGCDGPPDDDTPIGCLYCGGDPPEKDGEPDYSTWLNLDYCSPVCAAKYQEEREAEREDEEYWRNVEQEIKDTPDDW